MAQIPKPSFAPGHSLAPAALVAALQSCTAAMAAEWEPAEHMGEGMVQDEAEW